MWKASTWECLWSVPCEGRDIDFSHDGLRVLVQKHEKIHAYEIRSGDTLGEIDSMPYSMHDHIHEVSGEVRDKWECSKCKRSPLENGEYVFTTSDRWLWLVKEHDPRRMIHIPAEYTVNSIKGYSGYVAIGCESGLLVLDTACKAEVM